MGGDEASARGKKEEKDKKKLYTLAVFLKVETETSVWLYQMEEKIVKKSTRSPSRQNGQCPYYFPSTTTI